ncbi:sugar phosphate isomerase/epimerase family protein [Amycolatopsis nigrescens]|uniref:sugar phosphate isomerase/epimerase family protein n=1 Tax=Amycolatopsis nigrescens TaxID=381445 RepID=UPI00037DDE67|nr:sugar phosphate isomerase/epimerase [Amycolatopsis nigrescens]
MRIGCSTITFGPQGTEEAFDRIAELGFTVVDLAAVPGLFDHVRLVDPPPGELERVANSVRAHGFSVAGLQSVPGRLRTTDDPAELRRRYTLAADAAQAVGASAWVVDAGSPDPDGDAGRARGMDRFKAATSLAAELADQRGLRLGVEAPHHGTLAETLPEVLELLEQADLPQLGVDLDTSHLLASGASTGEILDAVGSRVCHVALRDAERGGGFCTPGDGDFDFAEFFTLLAEADYDGDVTLELEPARPDASADDRAREALRARRHLAPLVGPAQG